MKLLTRILKPAIKGGRSLDWWESDRHSRKVARAAEIFIAEINQTTGTISYLLPIDESGLTVYVIK